MVPGFVLFGYTISGSSYHHSSTYNLLLGSQGNILLILEEAPDW